jgi:hypothetical protein
MGVSEHTNQAQRGNPNMPGKLASAVALTLFSATAFAGLSQPAPVSVDLDNQFANGDMQTAATDKNDAVYIGCGTRNADDGQGGVFKFAFCQAEDAEGDVAVCFTENPDLVDAVRAISDYSYISFAWSDDGAGNLTCASIGLSTQSFYLGKAKN